MKSNEIFLFGSNQAGIHGAGAALVAKKKYGARQGMGEGLYGNSYALPTKDYNIETLLLSSIKHYVEQFLNFAVGQGSDLRFYVTRIGTGLAGYTDEQIAPMFEDATTNCIFDIAWKPYLGERYQYFEGEL